MLRRSAQRCAAPAPPRRRWSAIGGGDNVRERKGRAAVGIDFGTSSTLVALASSQALEPQLVRWADGARSQASVVHFPMEGSPIVGNVALQLRSLHPLRTIAGVKRLLGRSVADVPRALLNVLPYAVRDGPQRTAMIDFGNTRISATEVAALLLRGAKEAAEAEAPDGLGSVVLTVPAQWSEAQRRATLEAAEIAGLGGKQVTLLSEPLAAALSFGLTSADAAPIVIVDVGGGTMDVSVLKAGNPPYGVHSTLNPHFTAPGSSPASSSSPFSSPSSVPLFTTASHAGDALLGGQDFTNALHALLAPQWRAGGVTLGDVALAAEAEAEAEAVKVRLSSTGSTEGCVGGVNVALSRAEAEAAMWPMVERLLDLCREALQEAKLRLKDVKTLLLVGGQSRAPIIRHSLCRFFQRDPLYNSAPDEAVVSGAAVHAALHQRGAALLVRDVTAFALGVECVGGVFLPVLPRGSPLPSVAQMEVTTALDAQGLLRLRVLQGNAPRASDNKLLGTATLFPVAAARAGQPRLQLRFVLDAQGLLHVAASDPVSGSTAQVLASAPPTLGDDDLLRLMREAQAAKRAEAEAEASVKVRAEAEAVLKYVEESLTNMSDRIPPDEAVDLMGHVSGTRRALEAGRSATEVESALNALRNQLRDALQRWRLQSE